jgi:hypothetical protein
MKSVLRGIPDLSMEPDTRPGVSDDRRTGGNFTNAKTQPVIPADDRNNRLG